MFPDFLAQKTINPLITRTIPEEPANSYINIEIKEDSCYLLTNFVNNFLQSFLITCTIKVNEIF